MLLVLALLVWPVQIQLSINHIVMTARLCSEFFNRYTIQATAGGFIDACLL